MTIERLDFSFGIMILNFYRPMKLYARYKSNEYLYEISDPGLQIKIYNNTAVVPLIANITHTSIKFKFCLKLVNKKIILY